MYNKKIRNATPTVFDGRTFRSKLEAKFAMMLTEAKISYFYEAETMILIPKRHYNGKDVQPVTYTPDFILKHCIVEIKGFPNDVWPVKKKLIWDSIIREHKPEVLVELTTVSEMTEFINILKKAEGWKINADVILSYMPQYKEPERIKQLFMDNQFDLLIEEIYKTIEVIQKKQKNKKSQTSNILFRNDPVNDQILNLHTILYCLTVMKFEFLIEKGNFNMAIRNTMCNN